MNEIRKGVVVGRKSYNKDILFIVINIILTKKGKVVLLKGLYERIEADSDITDLEIIDKIEVEKRLKKIENELENRVSESKRNDINIRNKKIIFSNSERTQEKNESGKILHLDGDKKYTQKSYLYYRKMGLNSVVKNIPEYRQPKEVYRLLEIYNPDIVVITGHDGMLKKGGDYNNIYNYRNSKYFVDTVKEARRYDSIYNRNLVIFAGACQSYFEAIIMAGANFASSPARILIDFLDPLIVAEKVAITENYKYLTMDDIYQELRDGKRGINGIGAQGKMKKKQCNIFETNL